MGGLRAKSASNSAQNYCYIHRAIQSFITVTLRWLHEVWMLERWFQYRSGCMWAGCGTPFSTSSWGCRLWGCSRCSRVVFQLLWERRTSCWRPIPNFMPFDVLPPVAFPLAVSRHRRWESRRRWQCERCSRGVTSTSQSRSWVGCGFLDSLVKALHLH